MRKINTDLGRPWDWYFQQEGSIGAIGIRDVHDNIMYYIIIIIIVVSYWILTIQGRKNIRLKYINHNTILEIIWTITPAIILVLIAIPSFKLLYTMDEIYKPIVTLKIKGNQWFWSYEISDIEGLKINYDSYTIEESELKEGEIRLLEVDNEVRLPIKTPIRILLTSLDVIHSWSVPSLGIKVDAIPGRLNSGSIYILREGTYYGQCYELCGKNHGAMSIVVKGVSTLDYITWLLSTSEISLTNWIKIIKNIKQYI